MGFTVYKQRNRIHGTIKIFDKRQFFWGESCCEFYKYLSVTL